MSLDELKFNKIFTSDAYQCKTWHILQFLKWRKKCRKKKKKKENVFVAHFHKAIRPRPLTPFHLPPSFVPNERFIKLHNPGKFLEDSSFDSHFKDLQKLAKQSSWTYFRWFFME